MTSVSHPKVLSWQQLIALQATMQQKQVDAIKAPAQLNELLGVFAPGKTDDEIYKFNWLANIVDNEPDIPDSMITRQDVDQLVNIVNQAEQFNHALSDQFKDSPQTTQKSVISREDFALLFSRTDRLLDRSNQQALTEEQIDYLYEVLSHPTAQDTQASMLLKQKMMQSLLAQDIKIVCASDTNYAYFDPQAPQPCIAISANTLQKALEAHRESQQIDAEFAPFFTELTQQYGDNYREHYNEMTPEEQQRCLEYSQKKMSLFFAPDSTDIQRMFYHEAYHTIESDRRHVNTEGKFANSTKSEELDAEAFERAMRFERDNDDFAKDRYLALIANQDYWELKPDSSVETGIRHRVLKGDVLSTPPKLETLNLQVDLE